MKMKIRIEGTEEIAQKLRELVRLTNDDVIENALKAGAELVVEEAQRLVPVDTGNLRESIGMSTEEKRVNLAGGSLTNGHTNVFVGPLQGKGLPHDGFYGHMIEFGTYRAPPQPFMRPAFDAMAEKAMYVAIEYIGDEFDRIMRR